MKNIFKIIRADLRHIKTNVIALCVIIGLTVIPALYSWFNILSNWDPYGQASTSRIKVAVAGYTQKDLSEQSGVTLRSIQQYEQGKKKIQKASAETVRALARSLGCQMEDLL